MPRKAGKVPSYCLHKASGQAVVRVDGRDHYLGRYGSNESHESYQRRIADWRANRPDGASRSAKKTGQNDSTAELTVEQVLALFWRHAKSYYVKEGRPTGELANMKYAMRPLRQLYRSLPARDFGPIEMKTARQHMVDAKLCRTEVNARINRIKRIFKWATSEQLVPPHVFEGLRTVQALQYGRTSARESAPIRPVPDRWIDAVLPFVSEEVSAMIRLQRLTAMRPSEVVEMRMCHIDTTDEVWIYEPSDHKNRWRGHRRLVLLGPKAQQVIRPFMTVQMTDPLFRPIRAEERRNLKRRQLRASPLTPSHVNRKRKTHPKRAKRDRYDVHSYRRAITYGIKRAAKAGVTIPHWHPNQLRHSRATEVRRSHGIEGAQVTLGHAHTSATEIYAEQNLELALSIAKQTC